MKPRILLIISITFLWSITNSYGQSATTIYTPKGSSLTAYNNMPYMSNEEKDYWSWYVSYYYPNATEVSYRSATRNYNCHGYAWRVSESGSQVWIGLADYDPNPEDVEDIYWDDGSYIETTEEDASKISYYLGNHSAVQTATQGIYISKWDYRCLMQHARDYGPAAYQMSYRKYYKLNPSITGNTSVMCNNDQRTYTSNMSIPGSTYSWTRETNLFNYVSGAGTTSYTVSATNGTGDAWVQIQITTPSGEVAMSSKYYTWVGKAQVQSISGPGSTTPYTYNYYYANVNHSSGTTYDWMVSPPGPYVDPSPGEVNSCLVIFYTPGGYQVLARANNVCGTTTWCPKYVYVSGGKSMSMAPNPASEYVTITIKEDVLLSGNENITGEDNLKSSGPKNYKIRIYNNQGLLVSSLTGSGTTFNIPIQNMPDGIYIVESDDGKTILREQLVVKH